MTFAEACTFAGCAGQWIDVGTGLLAVCKAAELRPDHHVLDVGAGPLTAGVPLMGYLAPGRYCAIEPDLDVFGAAMDQPEISALASRARLCVAYRDDFDARGFGRKFDLVLAHSVLSHAAHWQLAQMLTALRPVLAPEGLVVASLRLRAQSSYDACWRYPDNTWFSAADVGVLADGCGYLATPRPAYRDILTAAAPNHVHDWMEFRLL